MTEDWISANTAQAMRSSGTEFTDAIIEHTKVGLVKARARLLVWDRQDRKIEERDCDVPQDFWLHGVATENWDQGDFGVLWNRSPAAWMAGPGAADSFAYGVKFLRTDIVAMLPSGALEDNPQPHGPEDKAAPFLVVRNPGGRRPHNWEAAMIELAGQLYDGELKPDTQANIEAAIKSYFSSGQIDIGDSTARDHARPLYQRLTRKDEN